MEKQKDIKLHCEGFAKLKDAANINDKKKFLKDYEINRNQ